MKTETLVLLCIVTILVSQCCHEQAEEQRDAQILNLVTKILNDDGTEN